MARPVTEVAAIPLQPGVDIDDLDSPTGKVVSDTLGTLRQQEGYQRAYKGLRVESPNILQIYIDWDSLDSHKKFMGQPYYGPFLKHLLSAVDGELGVHHVELTPHPPSAAVSGTFSPVTEVVGHYFAADISDSEKSTFESDLNKFAKVLEETAEGYKGFAGGWLLEEQEHGDMEGKAKVWQSCIGWDSVEAHMAYRETQAFKENVYLMRPESKKAVMMHHVKFHEKEYCPPLDPALFYAIISDYDLSDTSSAEAARRTLDTLKDGVTTEGDDAFDPSGSSRLYEGDPPSSPHGSSERAKSWNGDLASDSTDLTSISHRLSLINLDDPSSEVENGETRAERINTENPENMPTNQMKDILGEIFPTIKEFDIEYVMKKVKYDFGRAVEELLNQAFLESTDVDGEETILKRGIDGFLEPGHARGRKPNGKRKRQMRRTSSTPAPSGGTSIQSVTTQSRWDRAKEDVEFLAQRMNLPKSTISSTYHSSGASLPLTIAALCSSAFAVPVVHTASVDLDVIDTHAAELAVDFPILSPATVKGLIKLTYPSTASAHEIARVAWISPDWGNDSLVPHYVPRPPSPPRDSYRNKPKRLAMPLDAATRRAHASAAARSKAFTQASAAYQKSKSRSLMGGAASYYSAVGRDATASLQRYEAAVADARVNLQSRTGEVDLHGVSVKDAVRISQDQVEIWWEAEGQEWARAGKVMGGKGLRIVTGIGRHSEGGRGKLGPAVGAMLVREGWKVEIEQGVIHVTGKARR
ncbi:MAG: hypothetical protein Q9188_001539 [Gyalolechia gomerana]